MVERNEKPSQFDMLIQATRLFAEQYPDTVTPEDNFFFQVPFGDVAQANLQYIKDNIIEQDVPDPKHEPENSARRVIRLVAKMLDAQWRSEDSWVSFRHQHGDRFRGEIRPDDLPLFVAGYQRYIEKQKVCGFVEYDTEVVKSFSNSAFGRPVTKLRAPSVALVKQTIEALSMYPLWFKYVADKGEPRGLDGSWKQNTSRKHGEAPSYATWLANQFFQANQSKNAEVAYLSAEAEIGYTTPHRLLLDTYSQALRAVRRQPDPGNKPFEF